MNAVKSLIGAAAKQEAIRLPPSLGLPRMKAKAEEALGTVPKPVVPSMSNNALLTLPLSDPIPQTVVSQSSPSQLPSGVQVTTLPNGLRVATIGEPTGFAAVGLFGMAGARLDSENDVGAFHLFERMALKVRA